MKVDLSPKIECDRNVKIHLGYNAATSMNLAGNEHVSEEPNGQPFMTSHTYEVYLLPPGEGLKSPGEEQPPPTESEEKMKKDEPQVTNPTLFDKTEACNGEKGTLTLITQRRIIRRAYLNNKIIPA